ncbi:MAG: hypothetical protein WKF87_22660 [Chryseolinea sp.]
MHTLPNVPNYVSILFELTVIATLMLFYSVLRNASDAAMKKNASVILACTLVWLIFQAALAITGVYSSHLDKLPPMLILLGLFPAMLLILWLFLSKSGKFFLDNLSLKHYTYLNIVRVPVEMVLYLLYVYGTIPQLMTFENGNLDILAGLTAPVIGYFMFTRKAMNPKLFIAWHCICLALLLNIVVRAVLSFPFPMQQFAFDQPNIAIVHFPFIWLPTFIVMVVLVGHLVAIRRFARVV